MKENNETRLVGEERGSESVGKMDLEKVRKPVRNGEVDWDKGCYKNCPVARRDITAPQK